MNISKDLLLSILAMDAYNQGYGKGYDHGKSKIGSATVGLQSDISTDGDAYGAGFYAVSYKLGNETIISYRGTNEDSTESSEFFINALKDVWNGWAIGAGVTDGQRLVFGTKSWRLSVDADNTDIVMVDGTSIRVHHSAATLKKTTPAAVWAVQEVD